MAKMCRYLVGIHQSLVGIDVSEIDPYCGPIRFQHLLQITATKDGLLKATSRLFLHIQ